MSNYIFKEKYNTYFTPEYPNQFFMNYLNPFSIESRMAITITYPLLPNYEYLNKDKLSERPEINAGDVLSLFPQYRELIEQNGDIMVMLSFLIDLSMEMVSYTIVNNKAMYRYLVVLHVAHNLEQHIRDMKDEANHISLNNEDSTKNYYLEDFSKLLEKGVEDSFNITMYGRKFIEIYYPLATTDMKNNIKRKQRTFSNGGGKLW